MSGFKVLIVEDDNDARSNMVDILSLDGYQIETASLCQPAIELIENQEFGAVVVDWKLPDGSGADLFPIVFRNQPETPVIIVTGMRDFDVAVTALREGAYDFLLKPINADALRSVLKRVVERKHFRDEIQAAQDRLVQSERLAAIGQMMAGLAHESRNVFQKSHACLTNLAFDVREMPQSLTLVQKIQNALDHLNELLDEIRNYAAPVVLKQTLSDIESVVRDTWRQLTQAHAESGSIEFLVRRDPNLPGKIKFDRYRVGQVIWNLLENARFAVDPVTGQIDVSLECGEDQQSVRLVISDNGPGIPDEKSESIFEPFFTTKTQGTGLGLAICSRIVQAHGGKLSVGKSRLGGASFCVEFPMATESKTGA